jgi:hypothetical protein
MPAAMIPLEAKASGARVITIEPNGSEGDIWLSGTAATILPQLVGLAFGQRDNERPDRWSWFRLERPLC